MIRTPILISILVSHLTRGSSCPRWPHGQGQLVCAGWKWPTPRPFRAVHRRGIACPGLSAPQHEASETGQAESLLCPLVGSLWGSQPDQGHVREELDFRLSYLCLHINLHALLQLGSECLMQTTDRVQLDVGSSGRAGLWPHPCLQGGEMENKHLSLFVQVNFILFVSILRILLQKLTSPDARGSEQPQYK